LCAFCSSGASTTHSDALGRAKGAFDALESLPIVNLVLRASGNLLRVQLCRSVELLRLKEGFILFKNGFESTHSGARVRWDLHTFTLNESECVLIQVLKCDHSAGMLLTGCSNTLLTKFQDKQCVRNCDDTTKRENFEQPVIQTLQMFIGEMGCWLVIGIYSLYQRFQQKRAGVDGYQPVANAEPLEDPAEPSSPVLKALTAKAERPHLIGGKVLLLSLPASMFALISTKVTFLSDKSLLAVVCDICGTTLMNVGLLFVAASSECWLGNFPF
jgi:hypothetical protein